MPPPARTQPVVTVAVSDAQLAELEAVLNPKQVRQALFSAVEKTTNTGKTSLDRRIRATLNLSQKYTTGESKRGPALSARTQKDEPVGIISIARRSIPLIAYKPRFLKKGGARVTIGKNMPPVTYKHAFQARVTTAGDEVGAHEGHVGVFIRDDHLPSKGPNADKERQWRYKGKLRKATIKMTPKGRAGSFAIKEVMGPSILSVLGEEGTTKIAKEEFAKLETVLQKNLDSQIFRFTGTRPVR